MQRVTFNFHWIVATKRRTSQRSQDQKIQTVQLAKQRQASDLKNGASNKIYIVKGERVSSRGVVVKGIDGVQVEVESGLMKDDRVVLAPPAGLKDGDQVTVSQP